MARSKRKYWPRMLIIMKMLCAIWALLKPRLPSDWPSSVTVAADAICAAIPTLEAYDLAHRGGTKWPTEQQ